MRIITPGTPKITRPDYGWFELITVCGHCGCEFGFSPDDIKKEMISTPPKQRERTVFLKCPQEGCGLEVGVKLP